MVRLKLFEVRDRCTCISVAAFRPVSQDEGGPDHTAEYDAERFLLGHIGWHTNGDKFTYVIHLEHNTTHHYWHDWPSSSRTMQEAHRFIEEHFDEMTSGDVVDIEYILGETAVKKVSDRLSPGGVL